MTPEDFRDYLETKHVPLLLKLIGEEAAPISYKRNYLARDAAGNPAVMFGSSENVTWDCFSEIAFRDEAHLQKFQAAYGANMKAINEDEAKFFDHKKIIVARYETVGF